MGRPRNPESVYKVRIEDLGEPDELLRLSEAQEKYGLTAFHVYAAVKRGEVLRLRRKGGFSLYPESQLKLLARSIGLYSECSAA